MTPEDKALDKFCDEMDGYIEAVMEDGLDFDEAVAHAQSEYDEYWRALVESAERGELD